MVARYSLEDLRRLREQHLSDQIERVAAQVGRVSMAERAAEQALEACKRAQRKLDDARSSQASRLDDGQATVQDLARQAAWEGELLRQLEQATARRRQAASHLVSEQQAEARARGQLAEREAELKAVERHKQGWTDAIARAEELDIEEQSLEAWAARAPNRGRV